ncbi:MAG: type II secretion system GspH family protein [Gammaproteobacteria bacterium]|nr:type II secretion system GspH family protein [Gammaproteobacteria bacterium]MCI0590566.1 type II secretion system GspH family protein [Gammaproteobacteria bacterium]
MDRQNLRVAGFTLIEMVVVIMISAILAVVVGMNISRPIESFFDVTRRAQLVDIAETALQRMTREARLSLANSFRINTGATCTTDISTPTMLCGLEFLRTLDGGRYRAQQDGGGGGIVLNFNVNQQDATSSFDVLGQLDNVADIQLGSGSADCISGVADCLVIFNTGQPATVADAIAAGISTNAYLAASTLYDGNIATISSASTTSLGFDNSDIGTWNFGFSSPQQRFVVVDTPISFICDPGNGTITRRSDYPITAVQSTSPGGTSSLVANHVTACTFTYDAGAPTRSALVTIAITVSEEGEGVRLLQQIHVPNAP